MPEDKFLTNHILNSVREDNELGYYRLGSTLNVDSLPTFIESLERETLNKLNELEFQIHYGFDHNGYRI